MFSSEEFPDLHRAPMWMSLFETDDFTNDFLGQGLRMYFRLPTELLKPSSASFKKSLLPFVAGLSTNAVLAAELAEMLAGEGFHHKFDSLVHFLGFFPWHPEHSQKRRSFASLSPMF